MDGCVAISCKSFRLFPLHADLYGRTVKVSLIDREDTANKPPSEIAEAPEDEPDLLTMTSSAMSGSVLVSDHGSRNEPLQFHPRCGLHAAVVL